MFYSREKETTKNTYSVEITAKSVDKLFHRDFMLVLNNNELQIGLDNNKVSKLCGTPHTNQNDYLQIRLLSSARPSPASSSGLWSA